MQRVFILLIALIIDRIMGDPAWLYHPIRLIGSIIKNTEALLRKIFKTKLFFAGCLLCLISCSLIFLSIFFFLKIVFSVSKILYIIINVFFCYQLIALKCLSDEASRIYRYLKEDDIMNARKYLSYIVGRDTNNLSKEEITKAVVETVAENNSDGVTAPIFYFLIGGLPFMFLYKTVNTLDSMVGYKNDKYIFFGKYSAKFDDILNFIPSRLTGVCIVLASFICGFDYKSSWKIFKRDRLNHASPNSANTESAFAGALNIQLGGNAFYFGKLYEKPTIGDAVRNIETEDIKKSIKLMNVSSYIFVILLSIIYLATNMLI